MEYEGKAYSSEERCHKCNGELWYLEPPAFGWSYYCPSCQWLTTTRGDLEERLKNLEPGAIGVVSSVPFKLSLISPAPLSEEKT